MLVFLKEGFKRCQHKDKIFIKIKDGDIMFFVCLYVDDFIYTSNDRVILKKKKVRDDRDDMSILESYITLSPLKWFNLMLEFLFL
jgi:hypothetical protein